MKPSKQVVHVIDDDPAVRRSLALVLASADLEVAMHGGPELFLAAAPDLASSCLITDLRMPGMSGLDLMIHLRALGLTPPVILVTGHGDVALAVEAMKQGAWDFFEKPVDAEALIAAVRRALQSTATRVTADDAAAINAVLTLSAREKDVLRGVVAGRTNKMIARDLGISARTVEEYRAAARTKLGVRSLSGLVQVALRAGF